MIGDIPATKAKATASGTRAKATVNPEKTSSFMLPCDLSIHLNSLRNFIYNFIIYNYQHTINNYCLAQDIDYLNITSLTEAFFVKSCKGTERNRNSLTY